MTDSSWFTVYSTTPTAITALSKTKIQMARTNERKKNSKESCLRLLNAGLSIRARIWDGQIPTGKAMTPHLLSLTHHKFILIQLVNLTCTLHVSASGMSIQKPYKGTQNNNLRDCFHTATQCTVT